MSRPSWRLSNGRRLTGRMCPRCRIREILYDGIGAGYFCEGFDDDRCGWLLGHNDTPYRRQLQRDALARWQES